VLEAFSVSHGKAYPYLPLIELLKGYFQITLQDDERKRREKVTGKVLTLDRSLEDTLPYLFALLGISEPTSPLPQMDPQIKRRRTFEAIKRLLVRESLNQPLILIFEDLHWLDNESEAFLNVLREGMATARILLLVNYRPEYRHEWGSKTYYSQLRLDPLGKEEAQELLTALLGVGLKPLKQLILEKTEGNPFFMEEVVQTLAEERVLVGERGNYRLEKAPTTLHIPTTVQGVLAARIDRLPTKEKALLQTLAVIGKEFSLSLLQKVVEKPEDDLHRLLSHLQTAEFIYEQPAFPEPEYTFKHALTQEVAYNSLLIEQRSVLHERTAQAIEELYRYRLEDHYGELAHHYSRSGNTNEYRLYPVSQVLGGTVTYPVLQAREVLRFFREYMSTAPDELTAFAGILLLSGEPVFGLFVCYCGDLETAEKVLKPLRSFGSPTADLIRPAPYLEMQALIDVPSVERLSCYRKSSFLGELSDEAIDVIVANVGKAPSPTCVFYLLHFHGAVCRAGQGETAFNHREVGYDFWTDSYWQDLAEADSSIEWVNGFWEAMQPFSRGRVYVNNLGDEGEERAKAAYGANYERLVALKNKYDPTNFFRLNQNIKPTI
jgi:hypothetical protein